jgi:hypothetical protein
MICERTQAKAAHLFDVSLATFRLMLPCARQQPEMGSAFPIFGANTCGSSD